MATTTARKSRATRAAGKPGTDRQDQDQRPAQEQPKPESAGPYALAETQTYPKVFFRPQVQIYVPGPDGTEQIEVIDHCEHMDRYGHESEKAALACARRIAAQRGLRIGAPKA
jgi:hypothetical protein